MGDFSLFQPVETGRPQNRLNDGYVAPDGAQWFGSMDDSEQGRSGAGLPCEDRTRRPGADLTARYEGVDYVPDPARSWRVAPGA